MILIAFIAAYVFGREYADSTAKSMLTLPVGRHWFVLAKLLIILVWWVALVVLVLAEAFLIGIALGNLFGQTGWAVWFPWSIVPLRYTDITQ